jgi:hypothetical protein
LAFLGFLFGSRLGYRTGYFSNDHLCIALGRDTEFKKTKGTGDLVGRSDAFVKVPGITRFSDKISIYPPKRPQEFPGLFRLLRTPERPKEHKTRVQVCLFYPCFLRSWKKIAGVTTRIPRNDFKPRR